MSALCQKRTKCNAAKRALFDHFVEAHPVLSPRSRQALAEPSRGHFRRKPSRTIVTRWAIEAHFTRSASLFNNEVS
jgi:hypothetical protein